jgi:hypothetical protein
MPVKPKLWNGKTKVLFPQRFHRLLVDLTDDGKGPRIMSHTSDIAALALTSVLVAYAASASPLLPVQYEVYNNQQAAPRDQQPASDQQTVANEQAPSELQSQSAQHQSSEDQPQANEQPASSEQKDEQASAPPPAVEQPNAFVSEKANEPQDVAQTEPQSSEQSKAEGQQEGKSSEPPQSRPAAPSPEAESGEEHDP